MPDYYPANAAVDIDVELTPSGIRMRIDRARATINPAGFRLDTDGPTTQFFTVGESSEISMTSTHLILNLERDKHSAFFYPNSKMHKPITVYVKTSRTGFSSMDNLAVQAIDPKIQEAQEKQETQASQNRSSDDCSGKGEVPHWTLAVSSCQFPSTLIDHNIAYRSWQELKTRSECAASPLAVILLGDQIYTDATAGLFDDSDNTRRYVYPYDNLRTRLLAKRLPAQITFALPDDHELIDNWEPVTEKHQKTHAKTSNALEQGNKHFREQAKGFEVLEKSAPLYRPIDYDVPMFLCDSRTERDHRYVQNIFDANLISDEQFTTLTDWLSLQPSQHSNSNSNSNSNSEFKFIFSPSAVFPRPCCAVEHQVEHEGIVNRLPFNAAALRSDAWDGYPNTLFKLLSYIAKNEIKNVVFFSGDFHFSAVSHFTLRYKESVTTVASIHCSALYAPLPFANSEPSDFQMHDHFWFPTPSGKEVEKTKPGKAVTELNKRKELSDGFPLADAVECTVFTTPIPFGNGFCYVSNNTDEQNTVALACEFSNPREQRSHHCVVNLDGPAEAPNVISKDWNVGT